MESNQLDQLESNQLDQLESNQLDQLVSNQLDQLDQLHPVKIITQFRAGIMLHSMYMKVQDIIIMVFYDYLFHDLPFAMCHYTNVGYFTSN